jgi:glycosyltransferase involved in cell wall biosynthesis
MQTIDRIDSVDTPDRVDEAAGLLNKIPFAADLLDAVPLSGESRIMSGQNIVCFAKDWNGDPTSVTHVMKLLSEHNRVLWINSVATRSPDLRSASDLKKILDKLMGFARGPQRIHDNLWVYTPIVLPLLRNPLAIALNQAILRASIWLLRRKLDMKRFQLWAWPPSAGEYVDVLGQDFTVFYCTDSWADFSHVDGEKMALLEERLCRRADVVFATSRSLAAQKRKLNPETHLATHGVAFDQFAAALDPDLPTPADLADCKQPILGFYGLIEDWMDQDLLVQLAQRHPEWTIALIGKVCVDVSRLKACPNIRLLGRKPHSELPAYCRRFAVGLLPHKVNNLTLKMNPIKLREYLCAGVPVVSTALPEVAYYEKLCTTAESYEEFERAIEQAIRTDSPALRRERSEAMRGETWQGKIEALSAIVQQVQRRQQADA